MLVERAISRKRPHTIGGGPSIQLAKVEAPARTWRYAAKMMGWSGEDSPFMFVLLRGLLVIVVADPRPRSSSPSRRHLPQWAPSPRCSKNPAEVRKNPIDSAGLNRKHGPLPASPTEQ